MGARRHLRLAALALALAASASAQAPADSVRDAFERYRVAVLAGDGEAALDAVDSRTVAYYQRSVDLALDADSAAVAALPLMDRLMVFALRHRLSADTLRAMDGPAAFRYGVDQGWIDPGSVRRQSLGAVAAEGDSASATLMMGDVEAPGVAFAFRREGGRWRFDLTSVTDAASAPVREQLRQMGVTEHEFITLSLGAVTDRPVTASIWRPVGRGVAP